VLGGTAEFHAELGEPRLLQGLQRHALGTLGRGSPRGLLGADLAVPGSSKAAVPHGEPRPEQRLFPPGPPFGAVVLLATGGRVELRLVQPALLPHGCVGERLLQRTGAPVGRGGRRSGVRRRALPGPHAPLRHRTGARTPASGVSAVSIALLYLPREQPDEWRRVEACESSDASNDLHDHHAAQAAGPLQ
ncbi:Hypothetical protein (Fragment), partial [Durusdinium trenchii]